VNQTDLKLTNTNYKAPKKELWIGGETESETGVKYWYQHIRFCNLTMPDPQTSKPKISLLGYACDEGVRRNRGRIGASLGPDTIRMELAHLAFQKEGQSVTDYGNIICESGAMENCQSILADLTEKNLELGILSIVLGGGHDLAYGHFTGVYKALEKKGFSKVGIFNFDAHFDLRTVNKEPNSGTPFNQILTEHPNDVDYFALGIQKTANNSELFAIAKEKKVKYLFNYSCYMSNIDVIKCKITLFLEQVDALYVTVDLDGFSSAYAPGVSAPSPLGFEPDFVYKILTHLLESKKLVAFDIAELNPLFDQDGCTAKLAARIVDTVIQKI
tara:strand:+ start:18523 stop:19509 length:987 start_codon:yes stop_codon:yes gene_type:complete